VKVSESEWTELQTRFVASPAANWLFFQGTSSQENGQNNPTVRPRFGEGEATRNSSEPLVDDFRSGVFHSHGGTVLASHWMVYLKIPSKNLEDLIFRASPISGKLPTYVVPSFGVFNQSQLVLRLKNHQESESLNPQFRWLIRCSLCIITYKLT